MVSARWYAVVNALPTPAVSAPVLLGAVVVVTGVDARVPIPMRRRYASKEASFMASSGRFCCTTGIRSIDAPCQSKGRVVAAPASPLPPTGMDGITGACVIEISGGFVEVSGTGAAGCNVTEPGEIVVVGLTASVDVI